MIIGSLILFGIVAVYSGRYWPHHSGASWLHHSGDTDPPLADLTNWYQPYYSKRLVISFLLLDFPDFLSVIFNADIPAYWPPFFPRSGLTFRHTDPPEDLLFFSNGFVLCDKSKRYIQWLEQWYLWAHWSKFYCYEAWGQVKIRSPCQQGYPKPRSTGIWIR